jgi:hypothetical protein
MIDFNKIRDITQKLQSANKNSSIKKYENHIDEISENLLGKSVTDTNLYIIEAFYQSVFNFRLKIYGIFHPQLHAAIAAGARYAPLNFLIIAIQYQIDLTSAIQKNIKNADNDTIATYTDAFVGNVFLIHTIARTFPTEATNIVKEKIQEYIVAYSEYLTDHGWTIALPHYERDNQQLMELNDEYRVDVEQLKEEKNIIIDKLNKKYLAQEKSNADSGETNPRITMKLKRRREEFDKQIAIQPLTFKSFCPIKSDIDLTNRIGLKRFFAEIDNELLYTHTYGLDNTLENLIAFCNKVIFYKDGHATADTIEVLISAIKTEDVQTIQNIVIPNANIVSIACPMSLTADEVGFTPLMIAAKYCANPHTLEKGLFVGQKNKTDKARFINCKADHEPNKYNSLMVAARWGTPKIFAYLFDIAAPSFNLSKFDSILPLLECICMPYLKYHQNVEARKALLTILATMLLTGNTNYQLIFGERIVDDVTKAKLDLIKPPAPKNTLSNTAKTISHKKAATIKRQREENVVQHVESDQTPTPHSYKDTTLLSIFCCRHKKLRIAAEAKNNVSASLPTLSN